MSGPWAGVGAQGPMKRTRSSKSQTVWVEEAAPVAAVCGSLDMRRDFL